MIAHEQGVPVIEGRAPRDRALLEHRVFFAIALSFAFLVFTGFGESFFVRPATLPPLSPLIVVHAVVGTAWTLVVVAQGALVFTGNTRAHRALGVVGAAVAVGFVALGLATGFDALARGSTGPFEDPRSWLYASLSDTFFFTGLFAAGIALRRRREWHARLVTAANATVLFPAIGRLVRTFALPRELVVLLPLAMLGAIVVVDLVGRRRVHAATWVGIGAFVAKVALHLTVPRTAQWISLVDAFMR